MLVHLVSLENEDIESVYKTIRDELHKYDPSLSEKAEVVILSKTDMAVATKIKEARKIISKYNKDILEVSILDDASIKKLTDELTKRLNAAKPSEPLIQDHIE
jgi:GTPase involved in cell partitioning and DNA repair